MLHVLEAFHQVCNRPNTEQEAESCRPKAVDLSASRSVSAEEWVRWDLLVRVANLVHGSRHAAYMTGWTVDWSRPEIESTQR